MATAQRGQTVSQFVNLLPFQVCSIYTFPGLTNRDLLVKNPCAGRRILWEEVLAGGKSNWPMNEIQLREP